MVSSMINQSRLDELREEVGPDDLAEVIELFCEEVEEVLAALDATTQESLPDQLHFLKGSALNIGLDQVGELCRMEEQRLKTDPDRPPDVAAIRQAYADARQVLQEI